MLTKETIKKKALNKYNTYLKALVNNTNLFPLNIRGNKKFSQLDYTDALKTFEDLFKNSKNKTGFGYSFEYEEKKQIKITKVFFETEKDYIKFIDKEKQTEAFKSNISFLKEKLPINEKIILSNISKISKWSTSFCKNTTLITSFLINNPQSNLYQRELPIPVPTKFLENNINIITSFVSNFITLLNVDNKYQKLGLIDKSFILKIRGKSAFNILDNRNRESCTSDTIYLTPKDFESFTHSASRIFIVENETTFYNFPLAENDLCLYSGGFSILSFKDNKYLSQNNLYYFGDIDEHGFAILSMFRKIYPNTESVFMNMETINLFKKYCIKGKTYTGILDNLTVEELIAFEYIQSNNLRLEQEKIPTSHIKINLA